MRGGNYIPSHVLVRSVTFHSLSLPSTLSVRDTLSPTVALDPQSVEFTSRTLPARCLEKNRMLISYDIIFYTISFFCRHFSSGHTCDCISFFVVVLFVDTWTEPFSLLFVCEYACHFLLSLSCHDCWVLILDLGSWLRFVFRLELCCMGCSIPLLCAWDARDG